MGELDMEAQQEVEHLYPLLSHEEETMDHLLSAAQKNPSIQHIRIEEAAFRTKTLVNLLHEKRESLGTLSLSLAWFTRSQSSCDAIANEMKKCHSLEEIHLESLPDNFYVSILENGLSNHPSLRHLTLSETDSLAWGEIDSVAVQHFLQSSGPKLESLIFGNVHFTRLGLEPIVNGLLRHPTIELLAMKDCNFGDPAAVRDLATLLQSNKKILSLDFSWTKFNIDMTREILSALHKNKSLRRLNMMNCDLDDDTLIAHIQTLLHENETISQLNLSSNAFGASGAGLLAHGIQYLKEFKCQDCSLGDEGIRALLPLPTVEDSRFNLQELWLDGNNITHQGIRHLVEFLQHSSCQISCLSLCDNPINDNGSRVLADMLRTNRKLIELSLDCCDLTLSGLQVILSSLHSNQALEILSLGKITANNNDGNENDYNFLTVYNILSEFVPKCQLIKLDLDVDSDYLDDSPGLEFAGKDIDHGQDILLLAFEDNTTLEEVNVSNKFFHPQRQKKLAYYNVRNKFHIFLNSGHEEDTNTSAAEHEDNLTSIEVGDDPHLSTILTVPMGFWAHILEAAHEHYHDASVLYHLLSSRPDLIAGVQQKQDTDLSGALVETPSNLTDKNGVPPNLVEEPTHTDLAKNTADHDEGGNNDTIKKEAEVAMMDIVKKNGPRAVQIGESESKYALKFDRIKVGETLKQIPGDAKVGLVVGKFRTGISFLISLFLQLHLIAALIALISLVICFLVIFLVIVEATKAMMKRFHKAVASMTNDKTKND